MKCYSCGVETGINYENANAVLCSNCSASDEGKKMMAANSQHAGVGEKGRSVTAAMADQSVDYRTSLLVAKIVSAIGWVSCAIAVVIALSAFATAGKMVALALAPGLGVLIGGLILVITGQTSRAIMDSTNYSKQILEEIRKKV